MNSSYSVMTRLLILACALHLAMASQTAAQKLYWSELIPGGGGGGSLGASIIKQSDINGNGASTIVPVSAGNVAVHSISHEPTANRLYWTDRNRGLIQSAGLDGSNIQTVVTSTFFGQPGSVRGLAFDEIQSKMYWSDESFATVTRAGFDGSGATNVITGVLSEMVAVDASAGRLLFANNVGGAEGPHDAIDTSSLDGTLRHTIVSRIYQLTALDVDPIQQKVYWADVGLNALNDTAIRRANYDGSGVQTLMSNLADAILDLDVVPELNAMFWSSRDDGKIKRADLNGANPRTILSGLSQPHAIKILVPEPSALASLTLAGFGLLTIRRRLMCATLR